MNSPLRALQLPGVPRLVTALLIAAGLCRHHPASAVIGPPVPVASHVYEFDLSFADALGGPPMVPAGGSLNFTRYQFGPGQGPSVAGAVNPAHYTVEMVFRIDDTSGYRKLLDFKDRAVDGGLYCYNGQLTFYPAVAAAGASISPGVDVNLILTRDAGTGVVAGYVNGIVQFTFVDAAGDAVFSEPSAIIHFLRNDVHFTEDPSGSLDRVRLYPAPLDALQVKVVVGDVVVPPLVQFGAAGIFSVDEGAGMAAVEVTRSGDLNATVSVTVTTVDGSAVQVEDYLAASEVLTFAPGQGSQWMFVGIVDDAVPEGAEQLGLRLDNPVGAGIGAVPVAQLVIVDNDAVTPAHVFFAQPDGYLASELSSPAPIRVLRSGDLSGTVSVEINTSDGSAFWGPDYASSPMTLTFGPGEVFRDYDVAIFDDGVLEGGEFLYLNLYNPAGAIIAGPPQAILIITDSGSNAQPAQVEFAVGGFSVGEGAGLVEVVVNRTGGLNSTVQVDVSTTDGSAHVGMDYFASPATLIFGPGVVAQSYFVTIWDDAAPESMEDFQIQLGNPVGASVAGLNPITVSIQDDDAVPAYVQFAAVEGTVVPENAGTALVEVLRSGDLSGTVTVDLYTSDGTANSGADYFGGQYLLTFGPGVTSQFIAVTVVDDADVEGTEELNVHLGGAQGALTAGPAQVPLVIVDNDTNPPVASLRFELAEVSVVEGAGVVFLNVLREGDSGGTVVVDFFTVPGGALPGEDYEETAGTLTFGPGQTAGTILVPLVNDNVEESEEPFTVFLSNPAGATLGTPAVATVRIQDDDVVPYFVVTVLAGPGGTADPAGVVLRNAGSELSVAALPDPDQVVDVWFLDGVPVSTNEPVYTLPDIQADHNLYVTFRPTVYNVRSLAGEGGTVTPAGTQPVTPGSSLSFAAAAGAGYETDRWYLDNEEVQVGGASYLLSGVRSNHVILVTFRALMVTITGSAGPGGSIDPAGPVVVSHGADVGFTALPEAGHEADHWLRNGFPVQTGGLAYTAAGVVSNETVHVTFRRTGVPPLIVTSPASQVVTACGPLSLGVTATGDEPLLYQWYFRGVPVSGEISPVFQRSAIQPDEAGDYFVVVANDFGTAVSDVATVQAVDLTPPVLTCPSQVMAECSGGCETPVYYSVTAFDDCSPGVSVFVHPPSGSMFPPGTNYVWCSATDASGNETNCLFPVIVGNCAPASLAVTLDGTNLVIRWPGNYVGALLQCTETLEADVSVSVTNSQWLWVTNSPQYDPELCAWVLKVPVQAAARFWRLIVNLPQITTITPTVNGRDSTKTEPGMEVRLAVTVKQQNCADLRYLWHLGDGSFSTEASPRHRYTEPGIYQATVLVWCANFPLAARLAGVTVRVVRPAIAARAAPNSDSAETLVPAADALDPGLLVQLNDNDDDGDNRADHHDQAITGTAAQKTRDRGDMATVVFSIAPTNLPAGGRAFLRKLDGDGQIRLFDAADDTHLFSTAGQTSVNTDAQAAALFNRLRVGPVTNRLEGAEVGELLLVLEYKDAQNIVCSNKLKVTVFKLDLDVDANRNGIVDDLEDEKDEDAWTNGRGALYNVNFDRDGARTARGEPIPDAINFNEVGKPVDEDFTIENADDALDLAPLLIRKIGKRVPPGTKVFLKAARADDLRRVHIFKKIEAGALNPSIMGRAIGAAPPAELDITAWVDPASRTFTGDARTKDATFGIEGLFFRFVGATPAELEFDGYIGLTLELRRGARVLHADTVKLKVAPWMMLSHDQDSEQVWVQASGGNGFIGVPRRAYPARGALTNIAAAGIADGATVTLNDGARAARVFEFDKNGAVAAGRVQVDISTDVTAGDVRDRLLAAIESERTAAPTRLGIKAEVHPGIASVILLTNVVPGAAGNQAIAHTVGGAFAAVGMVDGTDETIRDGETFTINSGAATRVFEFDTDGTVAGANVRVNIAGVPTADGRRTVIIAAINGQAALNVQATPYGDNLPHAAYIRIFNQVGNQASGSARPLTETVAYPAFEVVGFSLNANLSFRRNAAADAGYFGLDDSGQLQEVAGPDSGGSQWFQDHVQIGYTRRPGGPATHMIFRLPYGGQSYDARNPRWPATRMLARNIGVFTLGTNITTAAAEWYAGNFGGNLEILPPTPGLPLGRITMGDSASPVLRTFLESQEVQRPVFDVPVNWLTVAHIDEVIAYLGANRVAIADPRRAWDLISDVANIPAADRPTTLFFATGRRPEGGVAGGGSSRRLYDGPAVGTIRTVPKADLVDGETFTLRAGAAAADVRVFEFELAGNGVAVGNRAIDLTPAAIVTADHIRDAIVAAVNAAGFGVQAVADGPGRVHLWNTTKGVAGNQAGGETVAAAAFSVSAMAGGKAGGRDFRGVAWNYVKFYRVGAGVPIGGRIAHISSLHDGWIEIDQGWLGPSKIINGGAVGGPAGGGARFEVHDLSERYPFGVPASWNGANPVAGDRYVLAEGTRFWKSGLPAMITVAEVLADTDFRDLNRTTIHDVMFTGAGSVKGTIDAAAAPRVLNWVSVPCLFFGEDGVGFAGDHSSVAFNPGPTNLQPLRGRMYPPRQFGPRNAAGADIYETDISAAVGGVVRYVDDWDVYHRLLGEVHCGSEVKRAVLGFDWWTRLP